MRCENRGVLRSDDVISVLIRVEASGARVSARAGVVPRAGSSVEVVSQRDRVIIAVAEPVTFTGDWRVRLTSLEDISITQSPTEPWTWRQSGAKACGRNVSADGVGRAVASVRRRKDRRLEMTGSYRNSIGTAIFTIALSKDGKSFGGTWQFNTHISRFTGVRVGRASRACEP